MEHDKSRIRRCAIYTRKSSEEGLEQQFNSLDAQREACEAFIRSQASEGWRLVKTGYDDGGLSAATMERPALKCLLSDVGEGRIDVVVVYKVDRLTRSLSDFARMVEVFDTRGVSFVAVTQQFNTTTSMGRLTLNVLLSFAQFEREVTGERIRDKIAASKRKGMWMGGMVPLGYDVQERRLVVNQAEAETVKHIFERYLKLGSVRLLKDELDRDGIVSKVRVSKSGVRSGGRPFSRGALYGMLANPIYVGEIRHNKARYPGQHGAIVDREIWNRVQRRLSEKAVRKGRPSTRSSSSLLAGKLFDENGDPLYVCGSSKGSRRYRYYVSRKLVRGSSEPVHGGWRLAACEIERTVVHATQQILDDHAGVAATLQEAGAPPTQIESTLKAVQAWRERLKSGLDVHVGNVIERVDLRADGVQVSVNLAPLIPQDGRVTARTRLRITRFVPLRIKRRGVELRLVFESDATPPPRTDPALLKAVARGHRWFAELVSGAATDTREIAKREGLPDSYVRRLIPLALLAPQLVEAICAGRQPPDLIVEELRRPGALPLEWEQQISALGLTD